MELLPQSREALDEYLAPAGDDLEDQLSDIESWAVRTVPECVAMSVTLLEEDLTFTFVNRAAEGVDAAVPAGATTPPAAGWHALDEEGWASLARQQAAAGIASTVSLPVVHRDRVVLGIDLYACTPHAFDDRLEDLARSLGAWQGGAVTNADLAFESRRRAEEAPQRLKERRTVEVAVGLLAARQGLDVDSARAMLHSCAHQAGIRDVQAALVLLAIPDH
jgi:GAF domain-containing protein